MFPPPSVTIEASTFLGSFFLVQRVCLVNARKPCHRLVAVCSVRISEPQFGVYGFRCRRLGPAFTFPITPHWRFDVVA